MKKTVLISIIIVALSAGPAIGGEVCSQMGGTCKAVCAQNEQAESGAFLDCSDKEECCVAVSPPSDADKPSGDSDGNTGGPRQPEHGTAR